MAFKLYKGNSNATGAMETFVASGAITKNMPVYLVAGASGAERGKVAMCTGGVAASEVIYGVAVETVADTANVQVLVLSDEMVFEVDAAADTNVTAVGQDNYLTATTLTLVVGASSSNGRKCQIIGKRGVTGARKYLCKLGNFGISDATGTLVAIRGTMTTASHSTASVLFTAPFAMRIVDVLVECLATSSSGTVTVRKATTAITNAIVCATVKNVTRVTTLESDALATLAKGDSITAIANATADTGYVTVIGYRI